MNIQVSDAQIWAHMSDQEKLGLTQEMKEHISSLTKERNRFKELYEDYSQEVDELQHERKKLKKENKAFQQALEVAFDALQYYSLVENQSGNFTFTATEAVKNVDQIMDKVFKK